MREPPPGAVFEPLTDYREYPAPEMESRSRAFAADLARRRTVRQFSDRPVPRSVVVIADPGLKRRIREVAEGAEREFYDRAPHNHL